MPAVRIVRGTPTLPPDLQAEFFEPMATRRLQESASFRAESSNSKGAISKHEKISRLREHRRIFPQAGGKPEMFSVRKNLALWES